MTRMPVLILAALLAALPAAVQAAPQPYVVVCALDWPVDDAMPVVVARAVREAQGAAALVFIIDTPGGRVDCAIDITNSIMSAKCPTIAYVKGMGAISAGALISYSCKRIVMAPGTNIGASAPVMMGMGQMPPDVDEKTKSFLRSRYRALGEVNGHDPLLGEAMVDSRIEVHARKDAQGKYVFEKFVKEEAPRPLPAAEPPGTGLDPAERALSDAVEKVVREVVGNRPPEGVPAAPQPEEGTAQPRILADGSELVCAAGELLTLTSNEAVQYGLASAKAATLDEALAAQGFDLLTRRVIERRWPELLFSWLTSPLISGLLLLVGIACIYIEIKTQSFGVIGIVGIACLAVLLGSYLMIGVADWLDLILVAIGLILVAVEIVYLPSHGALGVIGGLCLMAGIYFSLTRVPIPQYAWDYERLAAAGQTVAIAVSLFLLFAVATWRLFPKTPFYGWIVLTHSQQRQQGYTVQSEEQGRAAVGRQGVATSMLRPAGKGRFNDVTFDVVTRGEFIEPGRPIEIIEADGNRYVVSEQRVPEKQA